MPTGDESNRGSKFGDGPETQVRGPDPDGPETEPTQAIPESETILGGVDADCDVAAHTAGAAPAPLRLRTSPSSRARSSRSA